MQSANQINLQPRPMSQITTTTCTTQYNGGDFFHVQVYDDGKLVTISTIGQDIVQIKYENVTNVFVGIDNARDWGNSYQWKRDGNSVLLHLKGNRYVFINDMVYEFDIGTHDEIQRLYSPTLNSFVPYPYATSKTNSYCMRAIHIGGIPVIRNENLVGAKNNDPYVYFYNHEKTYGSGRELCNEVIKVDIVLTWDTSDHKKRKCVQKMEPTDNSK